MSHIEYKQRSSCGGPSRYCCFKGCQTNSAMKGIHLYRFPKDEKRCKAWVKACKNEKLLSIPIKDLNMKKVLCMNHFEDWCFMNITTKHRLVHNAIPNTKKFLVTRKLFHDNLTNISVSNNVGHLNNAPVSNNLDHLNNTSVSNNVDSKNDTSVSNNLDHLNNTSVSNNVGSKNDTSVLSNIGSKSDTSVSNNVNRLNNTSISKNIGHLNNTPVSNNVGYKNDTPVSNNVDCQKDTAVSNSVGRQNDTLVSNNVDRQNHTPVSNSVDCQSIILGELVTTSSTVSKVCKEAQFENNVKDCKKKQATIPTTLNVPKRPLIPSSGQQGKSYPKPGSMVLKTLKTNNPLAPKSAQILQITAPKSNNDQAVEQESEVVNEPLLEQGKSSLSKDKKNDLSKNEKVVKEKCDSPTTEVITYLICDVDQELTDFEKMLPILQDNSAMDFTQNIQIKDASNNRIIMQDTSSMSKVAEMESKVKKQYLEDKTNMLLKISNLEREIEGFRMRRKTDQRKIQNLLQLQRQKDRKIATLKKFIAESRQRNIARKNQDNQKIATLKKCIAELRQQNIARKNQGDQIYFLINRPNISKQ